MTKFKLTHGYTTEYFKTMEEVNAYIKKEMDGHKLGYYLLYEAEIKKGVFVKVFEYNTLYKEIYLIEPFGTHIEDEE